MCYSSMISVDHKSGFNLFYEKRRYIEDIKGFLKADLNL